MSEPVCVLPLALCLHGNRTIEWRVKIRNLGLQLIFLVALGAPLWWWQRCTLTRDRSLSRFLCFGRLFFHFCIFRFMLFVLFFCPLLICCFKNTSHWLQFVWLLCVSLILCVCVLDSSPADVSFFPARLDVSSRELQNVSRWIRQLWEDGEWRHARTWKPAQSLNVVIQTLSVAGRTG